jgi:hypothetical protein
MRRQADLTRDRQAARQKSISRTCACSKGSSVRNDLGLLADSLDRANRHSSAISLRRSPHCVDQYGKERQPSRRLPRATASSGMPHGQAEQCTSDRRKYGYSPPMRLGAARVGREQRGEKTSGERERGDGDEE